LNSFLLAFTALLILVLSALFAAPLFIDWNDYRPAFETQASLLLGRKVKVGGKVHLLLLPSPELRFDDVKVADQDGNFDKPLLEARSLEAWLNFGSMLSGTFEARKIAIVDPVLRIDVKPDGTGNWGDVGRRGVPLPFAPKEVMLDLISSERRQDRSHQRGCAAADARGHRRRGKRRLFVWTLQVSASYSFEGRTQELRFSTSAPDTAGLFRIKSGAARPERSITYLLDGDVTGLAGKPLYDGSIVLRVANAAPDAEPDAATAPDVEGQVQEPAQPQGEAPGPGPTQEPAPQADTASFFELKGPLKANPDHVELPDFDLVIHAKGRPQIFKGRLTLDMADKLKADAALEAAGSISMPVRRSSRRQWEGLRRAKCCICSPSRRCATLPSLVTPSSRSVSIRPASAAISSAISPPISRPVTASSRSSISRPRCPAIIASRFPAS
jgi:hypothetical protein